MECPNCALDNGHADGCIYGAIPTKLELKMPNGYYKVEDKIVPSLDTAEEAVRTLLRYVGVDPTDSGLMDTPKRVVRALAEMTAGYRDDPQAILSRVFRETYDELVISKDIPFTSMCEHHLLVFSGTVDIGYLPGGKGVVGLSKLSRLVDCFSRRLQVQERLTKQVAESIYQYLQASGVMVVVRASHSCQSCRGVRKSGSTMVTSSCLGLLRTDAAARNEFLTLCSK